MPAAVRRRAFARPLFALVAGVALAVVGAVAPASAAPADPSGVGTGVTHRTFEAGRYIVTLDDDPASTYTGGVSGFQATKPTPGSQLDSRQKRVADYRGFLAKQQRDIAGEVGARIQYSYTLALNGFAAQLTAEQASALATTRGVKDLQKDTVYRTTQDGPTASATPTPTATPPVNPTPAATPTQGPAPQQTADPAPTQQPKAQVQAPAAAGPQGGQTGTQYLGMDQVWSRVGGQGNAGKGVVVGLIDSGIAPENPSFAGAPLGTTPGPDPYLDGTTITYTRGDGGVFHSAAVTKAEGWDLSDYSTKLIGARYFDTGWLSGNTLPGTAAGEYDSPRDGSGHGSHTASTAAGDPNVAANVLGAPLGAISGVAPAAKIAMYKACWQGSDPTTEDDDGCAGSDLVAAIDAAIADGVDVINYSIGSATGQTALDATDLAFLNAASAGIFVSASAGNSGPGASTLDHSYPWYTTVAASSVPTYEATATFADGSKVPGGSITVVSQVGPAPVVYAGDIPAANVTAADAALCGPNTLNASAAGKIVVCDRGVVDRVAKSAETKRVGGIGLILRNVQAGQSVDLDSHSVPTVHTDGRFADAVLAEARKAGNTVTLTPGNSSDYVTPVPQVAGFSSRGPVLTEDQDVLKPDISAPGVAILAAVANAPDAAPQYALYSGTSMAAPHIAGLAAIQLGIDPKTTPAAIKSSLMTSAGNTVDANGAPVTDPFTQGAGQVRPLASLDPGLLYLAGQDDWYAFLQGSGYDAGATPIDPSDFNQASIAIGSLPGSQTVTRTVTATQAGTFTASVSGLAGVQATVTPSSITVTKGQSVTFTVGFTRTTAPLNAFATGFLTWTSGSTSVRSPIAVKPVALAAPDEVQGTGLTGSVPVTVTPGVTGVIPLSTTGLALGELQVDPKNRKSGHSGTGTTGQTATFTVDVPKGTVFTRFDLDTLDTTSDLDLTVSYPAKSPTEQWQSATASGDERVDLDAPQAGKYLVTVDYYDTGTGSATFDLVTTSIVPKKTAPLQLAPQQLQAVQGTPATYTASWSKLQEQRSYLGIVTYGDTGLRTLVSVKTGAKPAPTPPVNTAPPTISGTPEPGHQLRADPGSWTPSDAKFTYQWQADGKPVKGATQQAYVVRKADVGQSISVIVTATAEKVSASKESAAVKVRPLTIG